MATQGLTLARELFPDEPVTQRFAKVVIDNLIALGLLEQVPATRENIGAIVQTFARGEAFDDINEFARNIRFHFTFERTFPEARQVAESQGIVNREAFEEINRITAQLDDGLSIATPEDFFTDFGRRGDGAVAQPVAQPFEGPIPTPEGLFPGEPVTQRFAQIVINNLVALGLVDEIPLTVENVGALVQTFARGEAFDNLNTFARKLRFHLTFEETFKAARAAAADGIVNRLAFEEVNAVTARIDGGYTLTPGSGIGGQPSGEGPFGVGAGPGFGAPPGILEGGTVFQIDGGSFFIQYPIPGTGKTAVFEFGSESQLRATFGDMPAVHGISSQQWLAQLQAGTHIVVGEASEIIGLGGHFNTLWETSKITALAHAGIHDPSIVGKLLRDSEVQNIIALAAFSGMGTNINAPGIIAQLRNTNIWKNEIYPGIQFFYDRGDANPESAWRAYQSNISPGLRMLGMEPDADGSYRSQIRRYLDAGVSDSEFVTFLPTALKIQNNPDLKAQMDAWARFELGRNLNFDEFLNVLAGTSDPELNRIIEGATLADAAEKAGLDLSVEEIRGIAEDTDLTSIGALNAFTQAERDLLAIGDQELAQFGIQRMDFVDVAVGRAPRSGMQRAKVIALGSKLARERGISDDPTGQFFVGFTDRGVAQRQGLEPLRGEGG